MTPHRTLGVFVKLPVPGAVKTRLVPALGETGAAELYRALAEAVLAATEPRPGDYERLVYYAPRDAGEAMRSWLPGGRLRHQCEGDLGERMSDAFARAFARGAGRVALAGTDVPGLTREGVLAAFSALDDTDVVLGPALDGGYYLIALRAPAPALFRGVRWSTPDVLTQTLERAAVAGLSVAKLPPLRDLDTIEDLRAEWPALRRLLQHRRQLCAVIQEAVKTGTRK